MNMKFTFQLFIFAFIWALAACSGESPTQRESNPLKKYNGIENDIPQSQRDRIHFPKPPKVENDGPVIGCPNAYTMTIMSSDGDAGRTLQFLVGQSKIYRVSVQSDYPDLKLGLANKPNGMQLKKSGDKTWDLEFRPAPSQGNLGQDVEILVDVPHDRCVKGSLGEKIFVVVNVNSQQPIISVTGLDRSRMYQPDDKIPFDVTVKDPTLAASEQPQPPQFQYFDYNPTGEILYLNGAGASSCNGASPGGAPQTFVFHCVYDVQKVIGQNPGATVGISEFDVFGKSAAGEDSVHHSKQVRIALPAATTEPPPAPDATASAEPPPAPAEEKKEPAQAKSAKKKKKKKKPSQSLTQINLEIESGEYV